MSETTKYTTGEARNRFADLVNQAAYGEERVVLTRHGKDIAALVPISDLELLHELERVIDLEEAKAALKEADTKGALDLDTLKKDLGL